MKILVIDNKQSVLFLLKRVLTDLEYQVICCDNVFDAVLIYDDYKPDLVIIDAKMNITPEDLTEDGNNIVDTTEEAGLEVLKYIRFVKQDSIPVVVLLDGNDNELIEKSLELGANDVIQKPVSMNELEIKARELTGKKSIGIKSISSITEVVANEKKRLYS